MQYLRYISICLMCYMSSSSSLSFPINNTSTLQREAYTSLLRSEASSATFCSNPCSTVLRTYSRTDPNDLASSASAGGKSSTSKLTSRTSSSSSSSYSSYNGRNYASSSYRYTPSSYHPMYSTNLLTFILIYNIAHIEMSFLDVSEKQYCPLKYCRFINETTINTPLRRNVSMTEMIRQTNHTKNATTFQTIWMTTYGCSINFDECLTSNVDHSVSYVGWIMCLQYGMMLVFLCIHG